MWTHTLPAVLALACPSAPAATAPPAASLQVSQDSRPSTEAPTAFRDSEGSAQLTEQGWQYLPTYTGEHRWSLSAADRARTLAGYHLLCAATSLDDQNALAWWRRGHAAILLSNDFSARHPSPGDRPNLGLQALDAQTSLERSRELSPEDPWSAYALAVWRAEMGQPLASIRELEQAIELCAPGIESEGPDGTAAWLAFKCREWLGEVHMRAGQFEEVRASLQSFYADFGDNEWPLRIALGECALRERNFARAREEYAWIVEQPEFRDDPRAHAMLGYLEGLLGHEDLAAEHLSDAISRERTLELYARLWRWILAEDKRDELRPDLERFLKFPPPSLSEWDQSLGLFVLGEGSAGAFQARAQTELERRWEAGEDPGDLMCETHFYVGLRAELDARSTKEEAARKELLWAAREAYDRALAFRPIRWKWEWAYARQRYAALASELGTPRYLAPLGTWPPSPFATSEHQVHRLGQEAPESLANQEQLADLKTGDLILSRGIAYNENATFHVKPYWRLSLVR